MTGSEVIDRLKKLVDQDTLRVANRSYLDNPFVGKFDSDSFELIGKWRINARRRMFMPIAMGKLKSVDDGSKTILTLEVGPPPTNYIFPIFLSAAVLTLGIYKYASGDTGTLIWAIGFVPMFYIMALVAFNIYADKYVRFVAECLPGKEKP